MNDTIHNSAFLQVTIIPPTAPIQERVKKTSERLESDFPKIETKIHRFPQCLRWIWREEAERYIVPSFVSLGPYHHGLPHLQKTEELKHAVANHFCIQSGHPIEEVYGKVVSVAGEARGCYDEEDAIVAGFSDAEFAEMMFLDGCFLLQYMAPESDSDCPLLINRMMTSPGTCVIRDIMLLENQIPWLVLDALMCFKPSVDVHEFISSVIGQRVCIDRDRSTSVSRDGDGDAAKIPRGPNLLVLARSYLIDAMGHHDLELGSSKEGNSMATLLFSSAVELSEMGIKLTPIKKKTLFADMKFSGKKADLLPLFSEQRELSVTPLFLNVYTACWLVNMAVLEACCSKEPPCDGLVVSSHLSVLAILMDKKEDVYELRAKHIVNSSFSDEELLAFFKGLVMHLRLGERCLAMMGKIESYKRDRRRFIIVHKFFYHNWKIIVKVVSIASVLVGIFMAILSLKQN